MKILHLIQSTNLGGMQQSMYTLIRNLHGRGYEFTVVALYPLGKGKQILDDMGVPAFGNPYWGKFGLLSHHLYRREVKRHRPDLVLVTGPSVGNCWAASTFQHIPKVLTVHFHHGTSGWDRSCWQIFYRIFSRFFDKIIFNSDFLREEAGSIFPPLQSRSQTIPLPISIPSIVTEKERAQARMALGLGQKTQVIGNAGWLIERKRFDVLLRVAAALAQNHDNLEVVIAGSGKLEGALRTLAEELGIAPRVRWLGWQTDLTNFYRSLDILLFNSDADALGRTPLEAMAHGIPVVASVCYGGGLGETLRHQENGFLLPTHDGMRLAGYCDALLKEQELASRIGLAGREMIIARHHPERVVNIYRAIFDKLVYDRQASRQ
jgi:glycosyltransferase involved in cell wall biosynthesis